MIRYYTNREISNNLQIPLAKWKRWSREFLPPDPLGGLQSGYARQYNFNDAFTVFLGGHLVASLKYTIPEADAVLKGLRRWLIDKGFFLDLDEKAAPLQVIDTLVRDYRIYIQCETEVSLASSTFVYTIRGMLADQPVQYEGYPVRAEMYIDTVIRSESGPATPDVTVSRKVLDISRLHRFFRQKLGESN